MRFDKKTLWALAFGSAASVSATFTAADTSETDLLAANGLKNLAAYQSASGTNSTCTLENAVVRKEWSDLSNAERVNYTNAVLCLQSKPSRFNSSEVPGAKSRFDDFVAIHVNQTLTVHQTISFLSWHRYFVWLYETALRNECGYTGYQPYWNWGKYAFDPINSPLFDGSDYSMSGNGIYEPHNATDALTTGTNEIPAGSGGGCVQTGPFKNMTVNLGPVSPTLAEPEVVAVSSQFDYNPRCLKRDVSVWVSSRYTKDNDTSDLINSYPDVVSFQSRMQGNFTAGFYGVHTAGHYTIGGDPAGDLYVSPGDPAFWLHHAQIDRTWWMWQNQNLTARRWAAAGVTTLVLSNATRNGTVEDVIDMAVNNPEGKTTVIKDLLSTTEGPFCYVYA